MARAGLASVVLAALLAALVGSPAVPAQAPAWPDDFTTRLEALALIETLRAELLSHDSATLTLEAWCAGHGLAPPAERIVAALDHAVDKDATPAQLAELAVARQDELRYRRVRLSCAGHVVSEADNWYVPARLTPAMNEMLEHTDTSFGRAVQLLHFRRRTLASALLWHPLPENWATRPASEGATTGGLAIPHAVLENRAVLTLPDGTPFSEVVETYTNEILAFPPPTRR